MQEQGEAHHWMTGNKQELLKSVLSHHPLVSKETKTTMWWWNTTSTITEMRKRMIQGLTAAGKTIKTNF
eukprot:5742135-Ditylum_brightwellii.AAC.1